MFDISLSFQPIKETAIMSRDFLDVPGPKIVETFYWPSDRMSKKILIATIGTLVLP